MSTTRSEPLPLETHVAFDIAQGFTVGEGIVREAEYDEGWRYRVDVTAGDRGDMHRGPTGELWVWDFEVAPLAAPT